jgi:Ca-activated chloride channel family protein
MRRPLPSVAAFWLLLAGWVGTAAAVDSDLVLVLDASGSMWGQIDGENKIVIARRVLADVFDQLPDGANVGVVVYGHRREADCNDIQTVAPVGPIDRAALKKKIESIKPRGKTPIARSLAAVFEDLAKRDRPAIVVLISDGIETCKGDPCQEVRRAKEKGLKFVLHVIGFDVGDVDVSQLRCAAQAGDGLYFAADDAGQFTAALAQAVAKEKPAQ